MKVYYLSKKKKKNKQTNKRKSQKDKFQTTTLEKGMGGVFGMG